MHSRNNCPQVSAGWTRSCLPRILPKGNGGAYKPQREWQWGSARKAPRTTFPAGSVKVPETDGNPREAIPVKACTVGTLSLSFSLLASPQRLSLGASLCQSGCPRGELDWLINWFQTSSNCVKNHSNITQQHSVPTRLKACFYLLTTKLIADSWHLWRLWGLVTFPYTNKEIKEGRFLEQNKQQHDKTSLVLTVSVCFVCVYMCMHV